MHKAAFDPRLNISNAVLIFSKLYPAPSSVFLLTLQKGWEQMDFGSRCPGRNPRALAGEKGSIEDTTCPHFVFQHYTFPPATSTSSRLGQDVLLQYIPNGPIAFVALFGARTGVILQLLWDMATAQMKGNLLAWRDHVDCSMDTDTVALRGLHSGFHGAALPPQTHTYAEMKEQWLRLWTSRFTFPPD